MTGQEPPQDGVVRTALQLLPIPAHHDDFWARLEERLDLETAVERPAARRDTRSVAVAAVPAAPATTRGAPARPRAVPLERDPALALVPPALRRTSNALLVAVAAAAVAVVALAGNTLLDERNGTSVEADGGDASAELDALVHDAQPRSTTPSTLSASGEDASTDAVLAWVDDVGNGDGDGAWDAMGAASRSHFGSQSAFEDEMTSLAEGYGAWSAAEPDDVLVTPVGSGDEGTIAVVTLVGDVEQEGIAQPRAEAVPVRIVDGEVVVEPFAGAGELEVVVPEPVAEGGSTPEVAAGEELVVVVPVGVEAPILRLDDGDAVICGEAPGTELTPLEGAPGQRCSYLPEGGMRPGQHTLTAAFVGADGAAISAAALLFDAA